MSKHNKGDLQQMQSLPLEAKIIMTERRIRDWIDYWNGDVYVSFSGGKDSTVLKHIVDQMGYDIPAVFVNTGLEYPEIQQFVREVKAGKYDCFNSNVEILRPEMRFDEVIREYGYPVGSKRIALNIEYGRKAKERGDMQKFDEYVHGLRYGKKDGKEYRFMPVPEQLMPLVDSKFKISNKCCDVMKKNPLHKYQLITGRKTIMATMACESKQREAGWIKTGCNGFEMKDPKSKPMSFWTEQDILHYIKKFNVPYCPVYGEIQVKAKTDAIDGQINLIDYLGDYGPEDTLETTGCSRTGCMFCMFGCHLEKEPNRFQRMKETHPKQYAYCMDKLGLKEVLEYIGVPYE